MKMENLNGELRKFISLGRKILTLQIDPLPCEHPLKSSVPSRSVPFRSVPFWSVPFRSVPFRSVPFRSVPFRSVPFSCERGPSSA